MQRPQVSRLIINPSSPASGSTTIEYQRLRAKEMTKHFNKMKQEKALVDAKVLGWTPKNELTNGRWVMMGLAIGLLTEYATGVNFVDQIKLTLSYLGIVDVGD